MKYNRERLLPDDKKIMPTLLTALIIAPPSFAE